jgi:shikimate kinase
MTAAGAGAARRHILLMGLPAAGKTTVGRLVAQALRVPFVDGDAMVSAATGGATPGEILARDGEAVFRRLEREAIETALAGPPGVISPGGGWAVQPGALESVGGRAYLIYLRVDAETAARRAVGDPNVVRPLLGDDPAGLMRNLLARRDSFYRLADLIIDAEHASAPEVAARVIRAARESGGW